MFIHYHNVYIVSERKTSDDIVISSSSVKSVMSKDTGEYLLAGFRKYLLEECN